MENLPSRHSEEVNNFITQDVISLIKLKIKEKTAKKDAKFLALNMMMKKMEDSSNGEGEELSYPEILKTYEILERADSYEDQTILENTIGKFLESAPTIQNNVNSNLPTINGNINNLSIPASKVEEISKEELSFIKGIVSHVKAVSSKEESLGVINVEKIIKPEQEE